jgi:predicted ATPase
VNLNKKRINGWRLKSIKIENFLSFDTEAQMLQFDDKTTFLVGPNGSGKTNVIRTIKYIKDLINFYGSFVATPWAHRPHLPHQLTFRQSRHG